MFLSEITQALKLKLFGLKRMEKKARKTAQTVATIASGDEKVSTSPSQLLRGQATTAKSGELSTTKERFCSVDDLTFSLVTKPAIAESLTSLKGSAHETEI